MTRDRRRLAVGVSAGLVAMVGACGRPPRLGAPASRGGEPNMRVALFTDNQAARITAQGAVLATQRGAPALHLGPGDVVTIVPAGRGIAVQSAVGEGRYETLTFVSVTENRFVTVEGHPYRGTIEVFRSDDGLIVVNELGVEQYLRGVVPAELGQRAREQAALEAQAVASRTYALKNLGRFAADGFDLQAGVSDQAYGGVAAETAASSDAVAETAGMVLTFRGQLITAFFHSTCGYATASADEAFDTVRPQPYLQSVSDRRPGGFYCDISPHFRWTVEWDGATLRDVLQRTVPRVIGVEKAVLGDIESIGVRRTGPSGRATEVGIRVDEGEILVFAPYLRSVFTTPDGRPLGSTAIQLSSERVDGHVARLIAHGAGWGHGVGMCQWGAIGRARAGQEASTILTTYFPGATIERWY